jgi:HipA-like protein
MPASIRLYGLPVGVLDIARDGDLSFHYEQAWLERKQLPHHPLSLALPLSPDSYDHDRAGLVSRPRTRSFARHSLQSAGAEFQRSNSRLRRWSDANRTRFPTERVADTPRW